MKKEITLCHSCSTSFTKGFGGRRTIVKWSKKQKIIFMHLPVPETVGNVCFCRTETHSAWSEVRTTENKTGTRPVL